MRIRTATFVFAFLAAFLSAPVFGQNVMTGTWTIQPSSTPGKIDLELRADGEYGYHHEHDSSRFTPEDVGLRANDLQSPSHPVHFTMRRDAGSIDFTGSAGDGVGAGHFTFTPSASYAEGITKRGYDRPDIDHLLAATMLDISNAYIDSIVATGIRPSSYEKLIAFRALGVTPENIQELRRQFGTMDEENVITFTALHITPQYASEMRAAGISDLDARSLVSLRALRVDTAYIKELASLGYSNLSAHELEELKALHVDAAFIRRVQAHGYKHPTVQQLVELKAMRII